MDVATIARYSISSIREDIATLKERSRNDKQ
jgi:hypothetical protein